MTLCGLADVTYDVRLVLFIMCLCGDDEGSDLVVVTLCLTYVDVCVCDL